MTNSSGLLTGTIIFVIVGIIGCWYGNKLAIKNSNARISIGENRKLAFIVVIMSTFCMWLHWACAYMHQMNPIIQPQPELD